MAGNNLLAAKILRDSNTTKGGTNALAEQFPELYGAFKGLLGTAPDEVGGSVLDGSHQAQKAGAGYGFPIGLLANILPSAAPAINKTASILGKAAEPTVNAFVARTMANGGKPAQLLQDMAQGTQSPLTVWHGSPHKFDKFDASKIGTGEGAQAYGHGIYTAESPEVASEYAKNIMGPKATPENIALKVINATGDESVAAQRLRQIYPQMTDAEIQSSIGTAKDYQGNLYKVDLPDEHIAKMLDWDKPLSEQHPDVQAAIAKSKSLLPPNAIDDLGGDLSVMYGNDVTPSQWLNTWEDLGVRNGGELALQKSGIPGIRYLDGGSRGTGAGTSNFVVFPGNEGLLTILERNGQPVNELQKFVYPQEQALLTAQRNAALPVEQGGLGLHPNNTPMERAQAMGFDTEAFHGTPDDRLGRSRQFKDSMLGKTTQVEDAKMGHFTVNDGNAASEYIWRDGSTDGGNVLPLRLAGDRASVSLPGEWMPGRFDNVIQQSKRGGYDGLTIKGTTTLGKPGDYQVTFDPKNIRSRFAAFDPMRRDSPDILAGLLPLSMADEDTRNQLRGLLGY